MVDPHLEGPRSQLRPRHVEEESFVEDWTARLAMDAGLQLVADVREQADANVRVRQSGSGVRRREVGRLVQLQRQYGRLHVVLEAELDRAEVLLVYLTTAVQHCRLLAT